MMHPKKPQRKHLPRTHYNNRKKSKVAFDCPEAAEAYIFKHHINNVEIYLCPFCNFYHIGHRHTKRVKNKKKNNKRLAQ